MITVAIIAWLYASGMLLAATLISGDVQSPRIMRCMAFIAFWPVGVLLIIAAAIAAPEQSEQSRAKVSSP